MRFAYLSCPSHGVRRWCQSWLHIEKPGTSFSEACPQYPLLDLWSQRELRSGQEKAYSVFFGMQGRRPAISTLNPQRRAYSAAEKLAAVPCSFVYLWSWELQTGFRFKTVSRSPNTSSIQKRCWWQSISKREGLTLGYLIVHSGNDYLRGSYFTLPVRCSTKVSFNCVSPSSRPMPGKRVNGGERVSAQPGRYLKRHFCSVFDHNVRLYFLKRMLLKSGSTYEGDRRLRPIRCSLVPMLHHYPPVTAAALQQFISRLLGVYLHW